MIYAEANRREPLAITLRNGLEQAQTTVASLPGRLRQTMGKVVRSLPKVAYELANDAGEIALSGSGQDDQPKRFAVLLRELNHQARKHGRYLIFAIDEIQESPTADLADLVIFVHETAGTSSPALLLGAGLQNARAHLKTVRTYTERWDYLEKDVLFVPNGGMVEFRIPLTDRYIADHRSMLERRAQAKDTSASLTRKNT